MAEYDRKDMALKTIWTMVTMLQKDFPLPKSIAMKAFRTAWEMQEQENGRLPQTSEPRAD